MDDLLRLLAERTRRWRYFSWYWGDAIAVDGLLEAAALGVADAREDVAAQIEHWATTAPDSFDDPLAPGRAIVDLVVAGRVSSVAVDRFISSVERLPTLGPVPALEPHRPAFRFGVCIDAVYHLPTALAAHGRVSGDDRRVREAVRMATWTVDLLSCPGGWAQWYDHALEQNNGIPWSRGIGWAMLGLLDLLDIAGELDVTEEAETQATAMLSRLASTQGPSGNWRAVLDDERSPYETSTAAFFVASALHPVTRRLWTPPSDVLTHAADAVRASIDGEGLAQGVSADVLPSWDPATYREFQSEPSPWGQGAALRAVAALARASRAGEPIASSPARIASEDRRRSLFGGTGL